ncbi:MAG: GNAT family N-acetyltransferase [Polyangiaceae bacterium]|nr:GNAT family N-acetyltransferase [Polyangiaceae bacterium]
MIEGEVTLRFARPDDAPLVHALIVELAVYEREPNAVESTPATLRAQLEASPPVFECVLAHVGSEAAGLALFFHNFSTWRGRRGLYLEDLFVRPAWRRRGIGRLLFGELARLAEERGCARMEWAVLHWNLPAIEFYQSLGAKPLDDWTTFRLSDAALTRLAARRAAQR